MILIDSSVWIDFFNGPVTPETDYAAWAIQNDFVYIGDLILMEVLQGFRHDRQFRQAREALENLSTISLVGPEIAVLAARNYRLMRKRGITIRSTIDCLIATYCINNEITLLHADRDFSPFEAHLGLSVLHL